MNEKPVSDYDKERYLLGELPPEETDRIRRLAEADPGLRAELEGLLSSNREILSLYPPSTVTADLQERLKQSSGGVRGRRRIQQLFTMKRILTLSAAAAAALVLTVVVLPRLGKVSPTGSGIAEQDSSLVKGLPPVDLSKTQLLVHRKQNDQVEILTDGQRAREGDLLQLAYVAVEKPYGVILSIDGRGEITLHFLL